MKTYIILIGIIVGLILFGIWSNSERIKNKQIISEKENIISTKEQLIKNEKGQNASITNTWLLKYSELEKANSKEKNLRSDIEQKLSEAYENIEQYKRKNKDLITYYSALLEAKDTIYQPMPGDCFLKPIKTKFIDIDFIYKDSLVGTTYNYHTGINTLVLLSPKLKENGKKHWPNWGWLYGWDKKSITTVEDPNAKLTNQVSIEFKR